MLRLISTFTNFFLESLLMQPHAIWCPSPNSTDFILLFVYPNGLFSYLPALKCIAILHSLLNILFLPLSSIPCQIFFWKLQFWWFLVNDNFFLLRYARSSYFLVILCLLYQLKPHCYDFILSLFAWLLILDCRPRASQSFFHLSCLTFMIL